MRVLLVAHRFPPDGFGGVERYTQSLTTELQRRGERVAIVARRESTASLLPQLTRERLPEGATLYRIVGGTAAPARFLFDNERLRQLFTAAMIEFCPDVVHVNHLWCLDMLQSGREASASTVGSPGGLFQAPPAHGPSYHRLLESRGFLL